LQKLTGVWAGNHGWYAGISVADENTHLIVDEHFADFSLYLAGNFGHTSGMCLCGVRTTRVTRIHAGNVQGMAVS